MLKLKKMSQLCFLVLFIALIFAGKIQLWMIIFFSSVIATVILGRFYCGWICPTNTLIEFVESLYKKLDIKRKKVPGFIKNNKFKFILLLLFIMAMAFVLATGKKLPVLPFITISGLVLSLFIDPSMWHRYLCPNGTILSITGEFAKHSFCVNKEGCIKCGACYRACPAEAVSADDKNEAPEIKSGLCLECMKCVQICPMKAVKYH